ncbi:FAD-binding oxidoreductase [Microbacterium rhizomatis]|uniref:FAD-binding oxidoreductase n=1 Tax=Microbacterium rhizomatis TaxID=1631477 RepID=UPI001B87E618|nr:FAD-binding oxidoreductase [Microbacterium rhizomatis]
MTSSPLTPRRPAAWHTATVVAAVPETSSARRLTFEVPTWPGNDPGAHVDVRLTAPDGYQASRSYSIASSGEGTQVVLAVDEVPDGEVSPFLVEDLQVGDQLELHGPLGAFFIWQPTDQPRPVQLIAGGSGVVPLYAIAEAHARAGDASPFRLLYSVRTPDDVFFRREFSALPPSSVEVDYVYTRRAPAGWAGVTGRVTRDRLDEVVWPAASDPLVYVCGPTAFVETVADWLTAAGHRGSSIRTERFGGA